MNGKVTQKDIYDELKDFRREIIGMMEKQENRCIERYKDVRDDVEVNTNWRNKLTGQITVIVAVVGIGVNWLWDLFTNKN